MEPPADGRQSCVAAKRTLRADYKALRQALAADVNAWRNMNRALLAQVLMSCPPRKDQCAFVFLSLADEVDTAPLVDAYLEAGGQVLVPVIEDRDPMQACPFPGWDGLSEGVLGIRRPRLATVWSKPVDIALVPGLAFTRAGDRLGYGGGYYDRWLASHPETLRVGVCFDFQCTDFLPVQPHDVGMDLLVTNAGVYWTHRRPNFRPRLPPSC